ncbi:hypothetical protein BT63DRAFT_360612, partial [Microthyrium microscopicum]
KDFKIQPIGAPIGFHQQPSSKDDWAATESGAGKSYFQRNEANRKLLLKKFDKTYIRDFRNMDVNRGKFYLANTKLYKRDMALYMPNLRGRTLARGDGNTAPVLKGKVSVVVLFSRSWAEQQTKSFVGKKENPELWEALAEAGEGAQVVEVNHEEFRLSSLMVRLFEWNLRRVRSVEEQERYFILRGIPQVVKDNVALMNDKVGYVFLLDRDCRIRWSACGDAWDGEKESLVKGLQKL